MVQGENWQKPLLNAGIAVQKLSFVVFCGGSGLQVQIKT